MSGNKIGGGFSESAWQSGERRRTFSCKWCGGEHRRHSAEARECRRLAKKGKTLDVGAEKPQGERHAGSEVTRYATDPLKGNKLEHVIAKRLKDGMTARKAAKMFGVSIDVVKGVERKIGL